YNDGYGERDVDYQTFYDELSPHGRWVDYPGRGYVWIPNAGPDFRPYSTNGHWVYSENYEWIWVSDYDWGWAPFHYGRWDNDPSYGWYWVPGYEWSPAWVAWRDGGDYYGWAPIRPGISININFNIGGYSPPVDFWCFAPRRYISSPRIYDYCVPYRQNVTIINYTTIISNNFRYGGSYGFRSGPRRYDAERYTGRINPVRFRQSTTPGRSTFRNNEVSIFRPNVRRSNNTNVAPRNFERFDRNNNNSNNGFRRNTNTGNNDVTRRNDNTPGRVGSNDNNRFERRNDNNLPNRDPNRVVQPTDRPQRTREQGNSNGNTDTRRFERRTDNNGNSNNPAREPRVRGNENTPPVRQQTERRIEPRQQQQPQQQQQPRQFERRQESRPQPQMERRQSQPQPQQQQPRQFERRQESRPQPQQQQPSRQIERRDNGSSNSGNGSGRGRGRF
ncbi:MAG TPA: DUF6600 domain-containing protein, partial [Chitinophagaceae bacterium]|nr:DUF6600 domain-containing protein [Chitinophagaceae bacterium]